MRARQQPAWRQAAASCPRLGGLSTAVPCLAAAAQGQHTPDPPSLEMMALQPAVAAAQAYVAALHASTAAEQQLWQSAGASPPAPAGEEAAREPYQLDDANGSYVPRQLLGAVEGPHYGAGLRGACWAGELLRRGQDHTSPAVHHKSLLVGCRLEVQQAAGAVPNQCQQRHHEEHWTVQPSYQPCQSAEAAWPVWQAPVPTGCPPGAAE